MVATFAKIQDLVNLGLEEGARLIAGGLGKPNGLNSGYFVKPTIFADCNNEMAIMRQEIFGRYCR